MNSIGNRNGNRKGKIKSKRNKTRLGPTPSFGPLVLFPLRGHFPLPAASMYFFSVLDLWPRWHVGPRWQLHHLPLLLSRVTAMAQGEPQQNADYLAGDLAPRASLGLRYWSINRASQSPRSPQCTQFRHCKRWGRFGNRRRRSGNALASSFGAHGRAWEHRWWVMVSTVGSVEWIGYWSGGNCSSVLGHHHRAAHRHGRWSPCDKIW